MSTNNRIYFHGVQQNPTLMKILDKLNSKEIPVNFIDNNSPQNILNKVRNMHYNQLIQFIVATDYDGGIIARIIDSECEFVKFINFLNIEKAEIIE